MCVCLCDCDCDCECIYILQAFNVIAAVVKQRAEPGVTVQCKILEVRDTDVSHSCCHTGPCVPHCQPPCNLCLALQIVMAKLMDPGPVLVLSFQAQQLTLKTRHGEEGQVSCSSGNPEKRCIDAYMSSTG